MWSSPSGRSVERELRLPGFHPGPERVVGPLSPGDGLIELEQSADDLVAVLGN
jgi:hypothetical protein